MHIERTSQVFHLNDVQLSASFLFVLFLLDFCQFGAHLLGFNQKKVALQFFALDLCFIVDCWLTIWAIVIFRVWKVTLRLFVIWVIIEYFWSEVLYKEYLRNSLSCICKLGLENWFLKLVKVSNQLALLHFGGLFRPILEILARILRMASSCGTMLQIVYHNEILLKKHGEERSPNLPVDNLCAVFTTCLSNSV